MGESPFRQSGNPLLLVDNNHSIEIASVNGVLSSALDGGAMSPLGSGGSSSPAGILGTFGAAAYAKIISLLPTVTDIVLAEECGSNAVQWDATAGGTGTLTLNGTTWDFQTGVTSGGSIYQLNKASVKFNPNIRATPSAIYARVTKIANTATCDLEPCKWTDAIANPVTLGLLGATSQVNYTMKVGVAAAADLGVAQSAVGIYDNLLLLCDGTNYFSYIALGDAGLYAAAGAPVAAVNAGNAANSCLLQPFASSATNANSGFRIDKMMVVMPKAA